MHENNDLRGTCLAAETKPYYRQDHFLGGVIGTQQCSVDSSQWEQKLSGFGLRLDG